MGFEALLAAIDQYVDVRNQPREKAVTRMSDWDCGLATEFEDSLAQAERNEQLNRARMALEAALNDYIDERILAAVSAGSASTR